MVIHGNTKLNIHILFDPSFFSDVIVLFGQTVAVLRRSVVIESPESFCSTRIVLSTDKPWKTIQTNRNRIIPKQNGELPTNREPSKVLGWGNGHLDPLACGVCWTCLGYGWCMVENRLISQAWNRCHPTWDEDPKWHIYNIIHII